MLQYRCWPYRSESTELFLQPNFARNSFTSSRRQLDSYGGEPQQLRVPSQLDLANRELPICDGAQYRLGPFQVDCTECDILE